MTTGPITEPTGAGMPVDGQSLLSWHEALDQLQRHAERAIEMARNRRNGTVVDMEVAWVRPVNLGTLPTLLAERARRLVALQEHAAKLLRESRFAVEQELDALTAARTPGVPVYLDVTG